MSVASGGFLAVSSLNSTYLSVQDGVSLTGTVTFGIGHSDIEVTMTIYAHSSLDDKRRALGKLGDALH